MIISLSFSYFKTLFSGRIGFTVSNHDMYVYGEVKHREDTG